MSLPPVPTRKLGSQGLNASALGLGCMGMSFAFKITAGHGGDEESIQTIRRAIDLGITFLDTSDVYGPFENEELIGRAIKGIRDKVTLCTKCGIVISSSAEGESYGRMSYDGSRKHVREACEASLKRLGVDYIDLYYLHRVDPKTPVSETFAEMKLLVEEGKVRYVGISEAAPEDIRAAHAVCLISAVQLEWSLWTRDVEEDVIPVCRELGIGIVPFSPLGKGMLTGAFSKPDDIPEDDFRRQGVPRFKAGAFEKNLELVNAVKEIAAKKGCTPGQLALAWVLAQGDDVVPIPGTKRIKYLEENVGALAVQLTPQDIKELEAAVPPEKVMGDRYTDMKKSSYHYRKLAAA